MTILFLLLSTIFSGHAFAFCGFYVAKAGASLFNKTSQVILVRDGEKITLTMSSDFEGDVKDFAMVVPVPVVLKRDEIKTVDRSIFEMLDTYSSPRLVEYWDENPCTPRIVEDMVKNVPMATMSMDATTIGYAEAKDEVVHIEAQYQVDEYDILILSATESTGLKDWLIKNGYQIPQGAEEVLEPYINSGMKFFVVKVNEAELKKKNSQFLSPLQISFHSPKFMLPIRLGMANAKGTQDMIVYAFTHTGRVETTNYRTVEMPTGQNLPEFVKDVFGKFYVDAYRKNRAQQGKANVYLEYAWDISSNVSQFCDPCVGPPPMLEQMLTVGVDWVNQYHYGYNGQVFFTRLHVTYDRAHFPQDLAFEETPNTQNYQVRYVITHPALGEFKCDEGKKYVVNTIKRRHEEIQSLAWLTGWDVSSLSGYENDFYGFKIDNIPSFQMQPPRINNGNDADTTGMITPPSDSNHIQQGSFNAPYFGGDDSGSGGTPDNKLMIVAIGVLLLLLGMALSARLPKPRIAQ